MESKLESTQELRRRVDQHRQAHPKARQRDVALTLGVAEEQLVALDCGAGATRLRGPWPEWVAALEGLGRLTALTRNEHCVIEHRGLYRRTSFHGTVGQVLGDGVDLRLFTRNWGSAYAVLDRSVRPERRSLQVFDREGNAVHKVFLDEWSDAIGFGHLAQDFADPNQDPTCSPLDPREASRGAGSVRSEEHLSRLFDRWAGLRDTHEFTAMLCDLELGRRAAVRAVEGVHSRPVLRTAASYLLRRVTELGQVVMVFVGNPGAIQIHTGTVQRLAETPPWFNVLDPDFNLHLRESAIEEAWVVEKPTHHGGVTSLEIYADAEDAVALFFSKRGDRDPEATWWRELMVEIPGAR